MKKKVAIGCLGIPVVLLIIGGFLVYYFFYSLSNLPKGDFIQESTSPNETYTLKFYLVNPHTTVSTSIRGELINNKKDKNEGKTIYWEYKASEVKVKWLNEQTASINGHKLDVTKDKYDWRREE
jgi:hypothetical protein